MLLSISGVFFAVFIGNVVLGSSSNSPLVGDVGEMLLLFATSVFFVAAILKRAAADTESKRNT